MNINEYAVGWGTLSLINAGLAQGKGRSGLSWFILSLLLGPVATFFVVIMDPVTNRGRSTTGDPNRHVDASPTHRRSGKGDA